MLVCASVECRFRRRKGRLGLTRRALTQEKDFDTSFGMSKNPPRKARVQPLGSWAFWLNELPQSYTAGEEKSRLNSQHSSGVKY